MIELIEFIEIMIKKMDFDHKWVNWIVNWIMTCVGLVKYGVKVNFDLRV